MQMNPARRTIHPDVKLLRSITNKYPDIIFKTTDKNLGLVALNLETYDKLVHEHLDNTNNYKIYSQDSISTTTLLRQLEKKYFTFIDSYYFYPHERKYLKHFTTFRFPKFYITPKIHKSGELKGRPIVGAVQWITTPLSTILNLRLQPYLKRYDSILKNSQDLVQTLEKFNEMDLSSKNFTIITADVVSLYPNVNLTELTKIVTEEDFLLEDLTNWVCNNSFAKYKHSVYHQKSGIAMGTNAAVSLANLYLAKLLDPLVLAWTNYDFGNKQSTGHIFYYQRYIDDLFIIWQGTSKSLANFQRWLKHKLPANLKLEFTDPSTTNVPFLDLNISYNQYLNTFHTSIYQKALNRYAYISPFSNHVPHTFSGFIKGELTRYARLCTDVYTYQLIKDKFKQRLLARGYLFKDINNIFIKHQWVYRYNEAHTSSIRMMPFIIPYTNRPNISSLETYFHGIRDTLTDYIDHTQIKLVYSRTPNIQDMLCGSALTEAQIFRLRHKTTNNN